MTSVSRGGIISPYAENGREQASFRYLAERNAVNEGFARSEVVFLKDLSELEAQL